MGAGAFEKVKPHDLVLELQGRMPVQVMMESLSVDDFVKILTQTKGNLLTQAIELLRVDGVNLAFSEDSIRAMAEISYALNQQENIGARRLRTVLDRVLEEINFFALEIGSSSGEV